MANNKEQYLGRDGVSHLYLLIKNKLTTYFKTLFVSKKDGYDLSQNDFTNELKTKLENLDGSGGGNGEDEIFIIEPETFDQETNTGTFNQAIFETAIGCIGVKPVYIHCGEMFIPYTTEGVFALCRAEFSVVVNINPDTLSFTLEYVETTADKFDDNGLLKTQYLPNLGFYDDVVEGYLKPEDNLFYKEYRYDLVGMGVGNLYDSLITGESGKIYLDLHTNNTYRWSGSVYVKLESSAGLTALTNTEIDEIIASVDSSTE